MPTLVAGSSLVEHSVMHAGSVVDGGSHLSHSLLFPLSGAKRHGIVSDSIIGEGTVIHEGECGHSLLGPLVGFHHHALLIASPEHNPFMTPLPKNTLDCSANDWN